MWHRTRVKICGITRPEDAHRAAAAGADAIGLVFVPASGRHIGIEAATALRRGLPPLVSVVALFMDADADAVRAVASAVRPDLLQFHGAEDAAFCSAFGLPYIKAVPARQGADLDAWEAAHPQAAGLLIDGHDRGEMGGSGRSVSAGSLRGGSGVKPLLLAGGLRADNVADAIRRFRPWAVDVSSGVEGAPKDAPGIKDPALIDAFLREVRQADAASNPY